MNVKVQVSGDPDQMKLYVTDEVARSIADSVPKMVGLQFQVSLDQHCPKLRRIKEINDNSFENWG